MAQSAAPPVKNKFGAGVNIFSIYGSIAFYNPFSPVFLIIQIKLIRGKSI